jgi:hypothetical protein
MTNLIQFPIVPRPFPPHDAQPAPEYLRGWLPCLAVAESDAGPDDPEPMPIRGHAYDDGPAVVYYAPGIDASRMLESSAAMLWLSPCLLHIVSTVLTESLAAPDGIGRFVSPRWQAFRMAAACATGMMWDGDEDKPGIRQTLLRLARDEGVDFAAEYVAAALLVENGLFDRLKTPA